MLETILNARDPKINNAQSRTSSNLSLDQSASLMTLIFFF